MPHGNAVVDGDGIELCGIAAQRFYLLFHYLTYLMQMGMTRNKLSE